MDLNRLTTGDQVIGVSGIVLFIFSFFHWLGATASVATFSASGAASAWTFPVAWIAVLLGVALVIYVALKAFGVEIPDKVGSLTLAQIVLGVAALAFLLVLIKLIVGPNVPAHPSSISVSTSRKFGIFVGLLATIGLVAGAYLNVQADQKAA